ncbi:LysR family transcriptional regulator [Amycolatopsis eburnea]|uniref:LysR family transcriptional regulator n=1 Tax=Amycolatopsis eburnea TaxID=2267691 RepID=A0A3R9F7Y4_9PSEU|nr:LysR family transcriptional regulator [Amycolatopsis eburnea]RSD15357.1 LysR family transcriptional regulator [Amycolatopsis eburnea]
MELRQVEHFLAVVRSGSFTAAAQEVHVVQSALSASIRKLEGELGASLFDRTTRRVTLTEAGRALLPLAHRIVADVAAARGEVAAVSGLTRGRVSIGTIQTLTVVDLPSKLGEFRLRYPGVRIHVRESTVFDLTAGIADGELDLSFLAVPEPLAADLFSFASWSQDLVLLCRPGHRLAGRDRIPLAELADEPFVGFSGSGIEVMIARRFADAGVRRQRVCEATHMPLLVDLVAAGLGVSIVPRPVAEKSGLPYAPLAEPGFSRSIHLAGRGPRPANPAARALLAHLLDGPSALADGHEEQPEPGQHEGHRDGGQAR